MKVYDAASLRNVALIGHSGAGKTQLTSAALFDAGMVNRLGQVDDGTTVTDYDEEEIARKHTLGSSLAFAEWNKHKINLVDTPGVSNFLSDARAALRVVDLALVVVDAVSGVEVSTEKMWSAADELELPRLVVLNRVDRERASLDRSLESLHGAFGRSVIPIQLPIGEEKTFQGVVDLVTMKALTFADGKASEGDVPAGLKDQAQAAREALIEMVAEADDTLMEKFFEAGTLTQDELVGGLRRAVLARKVFPLLCTSATANVAIQPLLDAVVQYGPSPAERGMRAKHAKTGDDVVAQTSEAGAYCAFVWKTVADPFACALNGVEMLDVRLGDTVVILGTGPIGCWQAVMCRDRGASRVWMTDVSGDRLELAMDIIGRFVDDAFVAGEDNGVSEVMSRTNGEGASRVTVAAPAKQAQQAALEMAAKRGRIVYFAGLPKHDPVSPLDINQLHYKELAILGAYGATHRQYRITMDYLDRRKEDLGRVVTHRFPLERIAEAFETIRSGTGLKMVILP